MPNNTENQNLEKENDLETESKETEIGPEQYIEEIDNEGAVVITEARTMIDPEDPEQKEVVEEFEGDVMKLMEDTKKSIRESIEKGGDIFIEFPVRTLLCDTVKPVNYIDEGFVEDSLGLVNWQLEIDTLETTYDDEINDMYQQKIDSAENEEQENDAFVWRNSKLEQLRNKYNKAIERHERATDKVQNALEEFSKIMVMGGREDAIEHLNENYDSVDPGLIKQVESFEKPVLEADSIGDIEYVREIRDKDLDAIAEWGNNRRAVLEQIREAVDREGLLDKAGGDRDKAFDLWELNSIYLGKALIESYDIEESERERIYEKSRQQFDKEKDKRLSDMRAIHKKELQEQIGFTSIEDLQISKLGENGEYTDEMFESDSEKVKNRLLITKDDVEIEALSQVAHDIKLKMEERYIPRYLAMKKVMDAGGSTKISENVNEDVIRSINKEGVGELVELVYETQNIIPGGAESILSANYNGNTGKKIESVDDMVAYLKMEKDKIIKELKIESFEKKPLQKDLVKDEQYTRQMFDADMDYLSEWHKVEVNRARIIRSLKEIDDKLDQLNDFEAKYYQLLAEVSEKYGRYVEGKMNKQ